MPKSDKRIERNIARQLEELVNGCDRAKLAELLACWLVYGISESFSSLELDMPGFFSANKAHQTHLKKVVFEFIIKHADIKYRLSSSLLAFHLQYEKSGDMIHDPSSHRYVESAFRYLLKIKKPERVIIKHRDCASGNFLEKLLTALPKGAELLLESCHLSGLDELEFKALLQLVKRVTYLTITGDELYRWDRQQLKRFVSAVCANHSLIFLGLTHSHLNGLTLEQWKILSRLRKSPSLRVIDLDGNQVGELVRPKRLCVTKMDSDGDIMVVTSREHSFNSARLIADQLRVERHEHPKPPKKSTHGFGLSIFDGLRQTLRSEFFDSESSSVANGPS